MAIGKNGNGRHRASVIDPQVHACVEMGHLLGIAVER
jgi:hypothetical protein